MVILLVIWWLDRKSPRGHYHFFKESDEDGLTLLGRCQSVNPSLIQNTICCLQTQTLKTES